MTENDVVEKIRDCLVEVLGINKEEIKPDSSLINDLGAESLDLLDLVFRLEQTFDIRLSRGEIEARARKALSEEEFETNSVLTPQALENLKKELPEVSEEKFKPGLKSGDIAQLFTVRTFARLVKEKMEINENDTGK